MGDMVDTIENVVIDNILANSRILPQASRANQAVLTFAAVCFVAGILLLIFAIYLWLLSAFGQLLAVVCTGVIFLLLSATCAWSLATYRHKKIAQVHKDATEAIHLALKILKEDMGDAVQDHPKALLAGACIAGFVAGKKFL
jgi:hypothetical protein